MVVFEGDTVVIILPTQLKTINKGLVKGQYFEEKCEIFEVEVQKYKEKCLYLEEQSKTLLLIQETYRGEVDQYKKMVSIYEKQIQVLKREQKKELFLVGTGAAVVGVLVGLIIK